MRSKPVGLSSEYQMQKNNTQMGNGNAKKKKRQLKRIRRFELRFFKVLCLELCVDSYPNSWADSNAPPLGGGGMKCVLKTKRCAAKSHGSGWAFRSVNDFITITPCNFELTR